MSYKIPDIRSKDSAKLSGEHFEPEVVKMVNVARATAPELTDGIVWITSGSEQATGRLEYSLHYKFKALDFRISNVVGGDNSSKFWASRMAMALGADYDVVWKGNHIHCEYDPKTNPGNLNG